MIPAFVIGLREGLEAALIVGIIAAFLARSGRRDALRPMWLGVLAAVGICLAVGIGLQVADEALPQRQQEGLETIIALVAAGAVTWMIVWCRRHGPRMKSMIETDAADALANGSTIALVGMAFFAVLREGLETAVFLVAVFQQSARPVASGGGAVLGIAVAAVLGYAIYRGGVRINLARFFRITGVVLVLVAAGLVSSAVHTAHEAGWFDSLQSQAADLTTVIEPGSVLQALVTGMFGIQTQPTVGEVLAWLLYAIPMMTYVLWPSGRHLRTRATAATATLALILLVAAGCGSGSGSGGGSGDGKVAAVSITNQGCQPATLKVPAGDVTFKVTNDGADQVTEYEILDGDHILGEVENLPDGLTKSFSLTLDPGTFTTFCPGADNEKGALEVGGTALVAASVADKQAVARYRDYLIAQTALLVKRTQAFRNAIAAGGIQKAKQLYPTTREPYERVEPVAESFGDLDPLMDARAGDVPQSEWEGFHKLRSCSGRTTRPRVRRRSPTGCWPTRCGCRGLCRASLLQTAQIANGAKSLLDEVAASKITGEAGPVLAHRPVGLPGERRRREGRRRRRHPDPRQGRSGAAVRYRWRFTEVDQSLDP